MTLLDRVTDALECGEEYLGFCRACEAETDQVEPDARNYKCPDCGQFEVFGAEELLIMLV